MQDSSSRHHLHQLPPLRLLPRCRHVLHQLPPGPPHLKEELHRQDHLDFHRGHRRPSVLRVRPHDRYLQEIIGQDTGGALQGLLRSKWHRLHILVVGGHGHPQRFERLPIHIIRRAGSQNPYVRYLLVAAHHGRGKHVLDRLIDLSDNVPHYRQSSLVQMRDADSETSNQFYRVTILLDKSLPSTWILVILSSCLCYNSGPPDARTVGTKSTRGLDRLERSPGIK